MYKFSDIFCTYSIFLCVHVIHMHAARWFEPFCMVEVMMLWRDVVIPVTGLDIKGPKASSSRYGENRWLSRDVSPRFSHTYCNPFQTP